MRKIILFAVTAVMAVMVTGLTACTFAGGSTAAGPVPAGGVSAEKETAQSAEVGSEAGREPETMTITALNGNKEEIQLEVPYNPERVATLDMAALDILDNIGLGERVVGTASTSLDYLKSYAEDKNVLNLGTIKEADMEAVMACEPDIIFIGGRLASSYDALSEIAPVIYLETDSEAGVVGSVYKNAVTIASMFGLEGQIEEKMESFSGRIDRLAEAAEGKTAVIGMSTSGGFNVLGNDGRCSLIGREIGFDNLGDNDTTSTHGNETSFELIVDWNPDYLFVLDRDAAISTDGARMAREIVENELIMGTDAYKNGNIIYLENPAVWYTAEGGITALDIMLGDLDKLVRTPPQASGRGGGGEMSLSSYGKNVVSWGCRLYLPLRPKARFSPGRKTQPSVSPVRQPAAADCLTR